MKFKFYLVFLGAILLSPTLKAQCSEVELHTQADVDSFASLGCTEITYVLSISGNDITNLDGLSSLTKVGSIIINNSPNLTDISGLSNISEVSGQCQCQVHGIELRNLPALTNVDGFSGLRTNYGGIMVYDNANLSSLEGFSGLAMLGNNSDFGDQSIHLENNPALQDLTAFRNVSPTGGINLFNNDGLTNLNGLEKITTIGGQGLYINDNDSLVDISGLSSVHSIQLSLSITNNDLLPDLEGLRSLASVIPWKNMIGIAIGGNTSLLNLDGLSALSDVTGGMSYLTFKNNPELRSGCGLYPLFSNFTFMQEDITNNNGITKESILAGGGCACKENIILSTQAQVDAFPVTHGCKVAERTITITGVDITSLDGLSSLDSIRGSLIIRSNPELVSIDGLSSLKSVAIGLRGSFTNGKVEIVNNDKLTNIDGLSNLSSVGYNAGLGDESITIMDNAVLTSLAGLTSITRLRGGLNVAYNSALTNLDGLDNFTEQYNNGGIYLGNNPALVDIHALKSLTSVVQLYIVDNDALPNLNGLSALKKVTGKGPAGYIDIRENDALTNVDSLSSLTTMDSPTRTLRVINNPALVRGCGLYPLLSNAFNCAVCTRTVEITGNGPGVTEEEIMAGGACEGVDPQIPQQPTNLVFSEVTGGTVHLSFTGSPTPPAQYLILMRVGSSPYPDDIPQDGSVRYVGSTVGSSLVVGSAPGNVTEYDIVSLMPSTTYYFAIYSLTREVVYVKDPPLQGSITTSDGQTPSGLVFSNVSDNSMTVEFEAAEGYDGYLTLMRAFESGLPWDGPINGTDYSVGNVIGCCSIIVGKGTDTSLGIVYLEADVDYYFDVIPYTIEGTSYVYHFENVLSGNQRTMDRARPYPNPFVEQITIPFTIAEESANVKIVIMDQLGRVISEVVNQSYSTGSHQVQWNRSDLQGNRVNEGVYMYSISTNAREPVKGLVVAK